ncbi:prefoldin subunit 5 [Lipingzhangella halophila]|uniref:Prefoldin subunit 5 n=1 Tax=Lipingzhangella halophila TaxID=1783352 RepID=A0A7W7REU1_9ACTN|nr:hypothetical protein [Lipingzhangella halophila]MBB4930694.1 prefoldin subunit 5 [Lipingzhangella halophila]MBB4935440.1 prefoldin subunit 5 [Lipingzhangella halophila]MBB4935455.1 prefoldin subunit 5 [Lipingzhangella halophila]
MNHHEAKPLLKTLDEREQALTHQAEQTRAHIGELTTKLDELTQAITHLQITRTALLSLVGKDDVEPSTPPGALPTLPTSRS